MKWLTVIQWRSHCDLSGVMIGFPSITLTNPSVVLVWLQPYFISFNQGKPTRPTADLWEYWIHCVAFRGVLFHSSYFTAKSSVCNQEDRTEAAELNTDSVTQIILNKMTMKPEKALISQKLMCLLIISLDKFLKLFFLNLMLQILFSVLIVEKVQGGDEEHVSEYLLSAAWNRWHKVC